MTPCLPNGHFTLSGSLATGQAISEGDFIIYLDKWDESSTLGPPDLIKIPVSYSQGPLRSVDSRQTRYASPVSQNGDLN